MKRADDADVLAWAAEQDRLVVTRNYRHFAPLVAHFAAAHRSFSDVLFLPVSLPQGDVGAHVHALERWIEAHTAADPAGAAAGRSPIADSFGWLSSP